MSPSPSRRIDAASPLVIGVTFLLGFVAAVLAGWVAFRASIFLPAGAPFQCVTVGGLAAGSLALFQDSRPGQALALAAAFALVRVGFLQSQGWRPVAAGVAMAAGVWLSCLIFDLLRTSGIRFGKFLILGPLLGGIYLALTPLAETAALAAGDLVPAVLHRIFLGVVIGDGVGFGVEVAEMLLRPLRGRAA